MKKIFITFILGMVSLSIMSQAKKESNVIKWYSIEEAEKLMKVSPRPLFIDTYTDWCIWCKRMDNDTFTNKIIAEILNSKYYAVKFDAEGKQKVSFMGQTYFNDGKYGQAHQLAVALLQGQLSYPTVVFLVKNDQGKYEVAPVPGYKQPKEMEVLLSYFSDDNFKSKTWDEFQKSFTGKVR